jgi:hypothetical protein
MQLGILGGQVLPEQGGGEPAHCITGSERIAAVTGLWSTASHSMAAEHTNSSADKLLVAE